MAPTPNERNLKESNDSNGHSLQEDPSGSLKVPGLEVVLVTGGAGFVGCHTILELLKVGYRVVVVDSCLNSRAPKEVGGLPPALERVVAIAGKGVQFHLVSLLDRSALLKVFRMYKVDAVIHFAALKAVGESWKRPMDYYHNNLTGTITLLQVMSEVGCKRLVFSSSSTVYGTARYFPTDEEHPSGQGITSPYGRSKYFCEEMMKDLASVDKEWKIVMLRYFNPVGAHESGLIGDDPIGVPVNLMPFLAQCAVGRRDEVQVFGGDWDTPDGTCMRDFMHVMDLAQGHNAALAKVFEASFQGAKPYNLGRGEGLSVLQVITAFGRACGRDIPYRVVGRRRGDVRRTTCSGKLAQRELRWKSTRNLDDMCRDAWRWQKNNPNGYE